MPIENAIVVGAIALAFIVFAVTLAWGDYYTGKSHHPGPAE